MDSLKKYRKISPDFVINKANFLSYLANLNYVVYPNESTKTYHYIKAAMMADTTVFCKNFIAPISNYLNPINRPDRRNVMPFILDYNLKYFLSLKRQCENCCLEGIDSSLLQLSDLSLQISFIALKDQRFRNSQGKSNERLQMKYDSSNHMLLDQLLVSYDIPNNDTIIREVIYNLLLHSKDCFWSRKWLDRYMNSYRGYDKYEQHLKHFIKRSPCSNNLLKLLVQRELKTYMS